MSRVHTRPIPYHTIPYHTIPYHIYIELEDVHTLPSGSGRRSGGGSIQDPYHTKPYIEVEVEVDEEVEEGPYKIHTIPNHTISYIEVGGYPYSPKWKWRKKWRRVHTRSIPYHTIQRGGSRSGGRS